MKKVVKDNETKESVLQNKRPKKDENLELMLKEKKVFKKPTD